MAGRRAAPERPPPLSAKFDPGLVLALQAHAEAGGGGEAAISVVLYHEGDDLATGRGGRVPRGLAGTRDEAVGTVRFADLEQVAAVPNVTRIVAGIPPTPTSTPRPPRCQRSGDSGGDHRHGRACGTSPSPPERCTIGGSGASGQRR